VKQRVRLIIEIKQNRGLISVTFRQGSPQFDRSFVR
jgi:hypothetical protein